MLLAGEQVAVEVVLLGVKLLFFQLSLFFVLLAGEQVAAEVPILVVKLLLPYTNLIRNLFACDSDDHLIPSNLYSVACRDRVPSSSRT